MRRPRTCILHLASLVAAALLAGCGNGKNTSVDVVAIGEPPSLFDSGGRLSAGAQLLRAAMAEGLVGLDEQGQVIPGVADRWIVTDDGMSYIFRLRDGKWSAGGKLNAESVKAALTQALAGLRGTPLARDLAGIEDVRVMTGRVVEIRLKRPQPELLLLLAQPELGLLSRGQGAGPMKLRRDGVVAYLALVDPEERGLPADPDWQQAARPLRLRALPAAAAIASYNRGEAGAILGGKVEHFPLVDAAGLSRGAIRLDPVMGLFGLAVVHGDGFLGEAANREAIAMAIDRNGLIAALRVAGWAATSRIIPADIDDVPAGAAERWPALDVSARQAVAAARVQRWRGGKRDPVQLRLAMPQGPGADRLFASLAGDFAKAGLLAQRVGAGDAADLRLVDAVARYPHASWFFNQLSCDMLKGLCSADADRLVAEAAAASDATVRASLLAEAQTRLTETNSFIPFGAPIRWSLVRGSTTGFVANRLGYHPLMPLALRPK